MSTKEELQAWVNGINAYQKEDFTAAIEYFREIGDYSRILFNMAMIYSRLDDHDGAIQIYTRALRADPYLAVAYFQRAYSYFILDDYNSAYDDFSQALDLLLDNDAIDYTQMGLKYQLYRCEILFNRAMSLQQLNADSQANEDLSEARRTIRTPEQRSVIERSGGRNAAADSLTLFTVPFDGLFHVREDKLKNLTKKNFLKEAKVVAARDDDDFIGFTGAAIMAGVSGQTLGRNGTVARPAKDDSDVRKPGRSNTVGSDGKDSDRAPMTRSKSESRINTERDEGGRDRAPPLPNKIDSMPRRPGGDTMRRGGDGGGDTMRRGGDGGGDTMRRGGDGGGDTMRRGGDGGGGGENSTSRRAGGGEGVRPGERVQDGSNSMARRVKARQSSLPSRNGGGGNANGFGRNNGGGGPPTLAPAPTARGSGGRGNYDTMRSNDGSMGGGTIGRVGTNANKLKIKIHTKQTDAVIVYVEKPLTSLDVLTTRVMDKLKLKNPPLLQFKDEDMADGGGGENAGLVTIVDDDDLEMVVSGATGTLALWVKEREDEYY
ncbi:hypothetical protein BJ742DRAFT_781097 [Cladochytrium replicatum]|nr:hypothetical protein BJ742DRAFT_781097 [Cladochytrium replicatum]